MLTVQSADRKAALLGTGDGGETWRPSATLAGPLPGDRPPFAWVGMGRGRLLAWAPMLSADQFSSQGAPFLEGPDPHYDARPYLFRSSDAGRSWDVPISGPRLDTAHPAAPTVDGRGRLLLLDGRRPWTSDGGGVTWAARLVQVPADLEPGYVVARAGGALYALASRSDGAERSLLLGSLLRSTDAGIHWEELQLPAGQVSEVGRSTGEAGPSDPWPRPP